MDRAFLTKFFGLPRKAQAPKPRYEIEGDDGIFRPLERHGREFRATMAPGSVGHWHSLREAREGHTVRRLPARG